MGRSMRRQQAQLAVALVALCLRLGQGAEKLSGSWIGHGSKCASPLFTTATGVHDDCEWACEQDTNCLYFSLDKAGGSCIGCATQPNVPDAAFVMYAMRTGTPAPPNDMKWVPALLDGALAAPFDFRMVNRDSGATDPALTTQGDTNYLDATYVSLARQEHTSYYASTMGPEPGTLAVHRRDGLNPGAQATRAAASAYWSPSINQITEKVRYQNMYDAPEMFAHNQKLATSSMCTHSYEHPGEACCQFGFC